MAWATRPTAPQLLDRRRARARRAADDRHRQAARQFWTSWQTLANHPESSAAKPGRARQAQTLAERVRHARPRHRHIGARPPRSSTDSPARPARQGVATELAKLNQAINAATTAARPERHAGPPRPAARPALSRYGQVSVTDLGNGRIQRHARRRRSRSSTTRTATWPQTPPARGGNPGARLQLGALDDGPPRPRIRELPRDARRRRQAAGTTTSTPPTAADLLLRHGAATHRRRPRRPSVDRHRRPSAPARPINDIAHAPSPPCAAERRDQQYAGARRATSAPTSRRRANAAGDAEVAVDAARATAARTSRASRSTRRWPTCCASSAATRPRARAMTTIDEMLDTLINRAGRVGLYDHAPSPRTCRSARPRRPAPRQERLATDPEPDVAGGKRIKKPSDDPFGAARAMRLQRPSSRRSSAPERRRRVAQLARRDRHRRCLAHQIVQRVRELTSQAPTARRPDAERAGDQAADRPAHRRRPRARSTRLRRPLHLRRHEDRHAALLGRPPATPTRATPARRRARSAPA